MSGTLNEKKPFPWRKYGLSAVVLLLIVRMVWLYPRTGWSLKDVHQRAVTSQEAPQTSPIPKEIRHVVLISIDTCRADHLGCYGYSRKTSPNIDALASESVLFNHAVAPIPVTLPSHSSMLTGTIPPYHKVRGNHSYRLSSSNITLAEILRENGFTTGAVIGAFVLDSQFGLDQGFDTYVDEFKREEEIEAMFIYNERSAEQVTNFANAWLEKHRNEKLFLFLHYYDPHAPYKPHKQFTFTSFPFLCLPKDRYDGEIAYTDHYIGQVIKKLKDLNLYEHTLLIVTADHGESLGEHSEKAHAYFIYHSTVHVPLIVKVPAGPKGIKINDVVGLVDIVPTVCSLLGITAPANIQGKDLSAFFSNENSSVEQRYIYCESLYPTKFGLGPLFGLAGNCWKYIHSSNPELYNLIENPHETKNLLNQQKQQAAILRDKLRSILQDSDISSIAGNRITLNEQARKRLQSLGYVSTRAVDDEDIQFDRPGLDPKEFVDIYNFTEEFMELRLAKKFDKARKQCLKILAKWPDIKQLYYYLGLVAVDERDDELIIKYFSQYLAHADSDSKYFNMLIEPKYELAVAHANLGIAFGQKGQNERAIEHYKEALSHNPYMASVNYRMANIYLMQNNTAEAVKYYTMELSLNPDLPEAHYHFGNALFKQRKFEEAIRHYNKALTLKPAWQEARNNLRAAQAQRNQIQKAITSWNELLRKNPNQPDLHNSIASVMFQQGKFDEAVSHWNEALKLRPDWPKVLNNLAWIYAANKDQQFYKPAEAVGLAERACKLTGHKNPSFLDTLSIAYAAVGKLSEAIETAEKALELAQTTNQQQLAGEIKNHLERYKQDQP